MKMIKNGCPLEGEFNERKGSERNVREREDEGEAFGSIPSALLRKADASLASAMC